MPMSAARSSAAKAVAGSDQLDAGGLLQHEVGAARAVLRRIGAHLDARLARRDEIEADPGNVVDAAADARRDDERVRRAAGGNGDLLAAQPPGAAAAAVRRRLDMREPIARVPLLVREDDDLLAFGDVLQARRADRLVAGLQQAGCDQRDRARTARARDRGRAPPAPPSPRPDRSRGRRALRAPEAPQIPRSAISRQASREKPPALTMLRRRSKS